MKKILLLISIMVASDLVYGQDLHFSQYFTQPLNLNPGIAGFTDCDYRLSSSYKNQWSAVPAMFSTKYVAYDMTVFESNSGNSLGAGVSFFKDKAGSAAMGLTNINGSLAYAFRLNNKSVLSAGISGAWNQRSINIGGLTTDSQYDGSGVNTGLPNMEAGAAPYIFWDFGAGVVERANYGKGQSIILGLSALHVNMPRYSFGGTGDRLSIRYVGTLTITKLLKEKSYLVPTFLVMKQGPALELTGGLLYKLILGMDSKYTTENVSSYIMMGGQYRFRDALIVSLLYEHKHIVTFGLSYDINLSGLSKVTYARGGPEVSLIYKGFFSKKSARKKTSVRFN